MPIKIGKDGLLYRPILQDCLLYKLHRTHLLNQGACPLRFRKLRSRFLVKESLLKPKVINHHQVKQR